MYIATTSYALLCIQTETTITEEMSYCHIKGICIDNVWPSSCPSINSRNKCFNWERSLLNNANNSKSILHYLRDSFVPRDCPTGSKNYVCFSRICFHFTNCDVPVCVFANWFRLLDLSYFKLESFHFQFQEYQGKCWAAKLCQNAWMYMPTCPRLTSKFLWNCRHRVSVKRHQ